MKISYSLRAFGLYFIILGTLIWFTLDNAIERLNDGMRQSAESVLVDSANILAALIEAELTQDTINSDSIAHIFSKTAQRRFEAQIYQVTKTNVASSVYITDQHGIVIFDSGEQHSGKDFSQWRDVRLTLDGKYGARTSYIDQNNTAPDSPKAMVVAAPIKYQGAIIGVISVVNPIKSLEGHLVTETQQLQRYAFALLILALLIGYVLSLWFTYSLGKIANYANNMAEGKKVTSPVLHDSRLSELTDAISHLRSQLDGKEYVENYIHSLTHELKTPITSIQGAVELMSEDMPAQDRALFLSNIRTSNQRMSRLVDRMLSLAKLEGLTELVSTSEFDLVPTIKRLIQERSPTIQTRNILVQLPQQAHFHCVGDKVLLSQAVANLLDNAISFCNPDGLVDITLQNSETHYQVTIFNAGDAIPDFALGKLYERFFSLPRPIKQGNNANNSTKSTGLGLSFVKEIMKLHKGEITIRNIDGGVLATLIWPTFHSINK